jgi:predicted HicB family RNase H-like nuclease
MDTLQYLDYEGTAELDMQRSVCRGKLLFIDDLVTYESDTPVQLQSAFEEAVKDYIATCEQIRKAPQRPLRGVFNVRIPPSLHRAASVRALRDGVSLNELTHRALQAWVYPPAQVHHTVTFTFDGDARWLSSMSAAATPVLHWSASHAH